MKTTIRDYTERHPFLYMVETASYTVSTTDLHKFQALLCKIHSAEIKDFTISQAMKLNVDFTVVRK